MLIRALVKSTAEEAGATESRGEGSERAAPKAKRTRANPEWAVAKLWVGAGRKMKMRPGIWWVRLPTRSGSMPG